VHCQSERHDERDLLRDEADDPGQREPADATGNAVGERERGPQPRAGTTSPRESTATPRVVPTERVSSCAVEIRSSDVAPWAA
jgi:hypothetical protein